jgi:ketosteroid isomerase-like protein
MGAPSPEFCNLWLARAFNAQDVEAAAAMYHPDAAIVQVDEVHGGTTVARGASAIRETMAAYVGLKPHMDVVTHHTTVAGDFAMTRSQWLITGVDQNGEPIEVHHHGIEVHRRNMGVLHRPPVRRRPPWAVVRPPNTE